MGIPDNMQYSALLKLRSQHPAWRLLAAEQCSFTAAFLYQEFMYRNQRAVPEEQLREDLANYICDLHDEGEANDILRPASDYLSIWSDAQHSWLRRFYVNPGEPCYDLTAAAQRAIEWLLGLKKQSFIGTESRIRIVVDLLRELSWDTNADMEQRIMQLEQQKGIIEREIDRLKSGGSTEVISPIQAKDKYIHAAETARSILADFREVEENFRDLERNLMEQIITWKKGKGELLERFFKDRDYIQNSEQGRSFGAFWDYLMNKTSQQDMEGYLEQILQRSELQEAEEQYDLRHIRRQWSEAARQVMDTVSNLSRQIRQYVDEGYLEQERYIYQQIKAAEDKALQLKANMPRNMDFMEMDKTSPEFDFVMDRPLFVPPRKPKLQGSDLQQGEETGSVEAMFSQAYVEKTQLKNNIKELLKDRESVSLAEVIEKYPVTMGLTELLTYMVIASGDSRSFTDGLRQQLTVANSNRLDINVEMDKIVFYRQEGG